MRAQPAFFDFLDLRQLAPSVKLLFQLSSNFPLAQEYYCFYMCDGSCNTGFHSGEQMLFQQLSLGYFLPVPQHRRSLSRLLKTAQIHFFRFRLISRRSNYQLNLSKNIKHFCLVLTDQWIFCFQTMQDIKINFKLSSARGKNTRRRSMV